MTVTLDRCAGSGRAPTAIEQHPRDGKRPIVLGVCPTCGAWVACLRNGMLHPHVNWPMRLHRLTTEGKP